MDIQQRPGEPFARIGDRYRFNNDRAWCIDCGARLTFTTTTLVGDTTTWIATHDREHNGES